MTPRSSRGLLGQAWKQAKGKASGEAMTAGWAEGSSFMLPHDGVYSRTKAATESHLPVVLDGFIGKAFSDTSQFCLTERIS